MKLTLVGALIFAGVGAAPSDALAQTVRTSTTVSAGAGVATNPFLESNGKTAGSVTISVDPAIFLEDEKGQLSISGGVRYSQYTNRYGGDLALRLAAETRRLLDERTQLQAGASATSSRSALQDDLAAGLGGLLDSGVKSSYQPDFLDPTLAGTRRRVNRFAVNAGIERALDPVSSINGGIGASYTKSDGIGFDYRQFSGQVGYSRKLDEHSSVGLIGGFGRTDYVGRDIGDSTILSPAVQYQRQITQTLDLRLSAGVNFVRTDIASGTRSWTTLSGSATLCDRRDNRAICAIVSRSALPTAFGGVSKVTSFAANYDVRLSRDSRFSAAARYSRTGNDLLSANFPTPPGRNLFGAQARYSLDLNDRLSLWVSPSATFLTGGAADRSPNYTINAGITMRFGDR